jgi:hypothetical protein
MAVTEDKHAHDGDQPKPSPGDKSSAPSDESSGAGAGATELLRDALVDDDDPRFPFWLPLPGILLAGGWALYDASASGGSFLPTLLWPGAAIFVLGTLAAWLGWQLDID